MRKPIKFEVVTKAKDSSFSLIVENAKEDEEYVIRTNPEILMLEEGDEHVYLLRVQGKEGDEFTLNITGANPDYPPATTKIPKGKKLNAMLDDFTA